VNEKIEAQRIRRAERDGRTGRWRAFFPGRKLLPFIVAMSVHVSPLAASESVFLLGMVVSGLAPNQNVKGYVLDEGGARYPMLVDMSVTVTDADFADIRRVSDPPNGIRIVLSGEGRKKFKAMVRGAMGRQLAIVYKDRIVSAPVLMTEDIGSELTVSGNLTPEEADSAVEIRK
jgi:preprotein translocase subunit SecD